ncbi:MAG TPA: hypothetical protein DCZ95_10100 [Verrucomicrobia bacterium]|nr:MAG: hypothetical protein A2X46_00320 [Lentisphaerae bacterium GWF2_57_35]HBA84433.1 hypothetical protein [Verrucomicrobiota bacterium]
MKSIMKLIGAAVLFFLPTVILAQTDGTATFRVSTKTANGNYAPNHVLAIWVTDAQTNFVKTLKRQAASRIQYLTQWGPKSQSNVVDGITGATLNSHRTHLLTWNCRNTSGAVVPDGTYRFYVEFTENNASGPWTSTNVLSFYKGTAGATSSPPNQAHFTNMLVTYAPGGAVTVHDIRLLSITAPASMTPGATTNLFVTATNAGTATEAFTVSLRDVTDARSIGSRSVAGLAAGKATNVLIQWNTAGASIGLHSLVATSSVVAGETQLSNNTCYGSTIFAYAGETNVLISKGAVWKYNNTGVDLSGTPWRNANYYDGFWSEGPAALGFGDSEDVLSTAITPSRNTCYFRREVYVDMTPLSISMKIRRDDGIVVYLNGSEIYRNNMPLGDVSYNTMAASAVYGAAETNDVVFTTSSNLFAIGRNVLSAEVHQGPAHNSPPDSSTPDLAFNLELTVVQPQYVRTHSVAASVIVSSGNVLQGDRVGIDVALTNQSNATQPFTVILVNTNTGQIVASQTVTGLTPGQFTSLHLDWPTLGALPGTHTLKAGTIANGVTNFSGGLTTVSILGAAAGLNAVNATGSVGGICSAVAVQGATLYVGAGAVLLLMDRTNPAAPSPLASLALPGPIESIVVTGAHAYVACGQAGVQIVDVSHPRSPLHAASFDTSGSAHGLALLGNQLLVADGAAGLRILNIAHPLSPSLVGAYRTAGPARAVVVYGDLVYLLNHHLGVEILDIGNPAAPARIGASSAISGGKAMAVKDSVFYLVDDNAQLSNVDTFMPNFPVVFSRLYLGAVGHDALISGQALYVAAGAAGVLTLDISSELAPQAVYTNTSAGEARALALAGSTLYVANGFSGLQILDVSSPLTPVPVSAFSTGHRSSSVVATNGLAYVAAGEAGLRIYSLQYPGRLVLMGSSLAAANARALAVAGGLALVGDGDAGLKIFSVTNPLAPRLIGSYATTNLVQVRAVAVSGSLAALTDGRRVHVIDISSPAAPSARGLWTAPAFVQDLAFSGSRIYVAAGEYGLAILDASNPSQPSFLGSYNTPGLAMSVIVSGTNALVADNNSGWLALNVSNPTTPTLRTSIAGAVNSLAQAGPLLVTVGGAGELNALDVSNILVPVPRKQFNTLVQVLKVSAAGPYALAAQDAAGLSVFAIGAIDANQDQLPDDWQQRVVDADPNDAIAQPADVRPDADFDGDGLSNRAEYLAGTDPADPSSVFAAANVSTAATPGSYTVRWHSMPGKTYTLYKSTHLLAGFTVLQAGLTATPPLNSYTDSSGSGAAYYMIGLDE